MSDGRVRIVLVAEAASDARRCAALADRVIEESPVTRSLLADLSIELFRCWQGLSPTQDFLDIHHVPRLGRTRRLRVHGEFSNRKNAKDAYLCRLTLLLFKMARPGVDALVIVRDSDGRLDDTENGFRLATERTPVPFAVVVGIPQEAMEAWMLAGYVANGPHEQTALRQARQELGYWPNEQAHRMSHKKHGKHSAKRLWSVLRTVSEGDLEQRCLSAPLSLLRQNGHASGLTVFLQRVEDKLVPLLGRG